MMTGAIRTHFDYTAWASARLVTAAGSLSPEELTYRLPIVSVTGRVP